jgi:hypothetical protein
LKIAQKFLLVVAVLVPVILSIALTGVRGFDALDEELELVHVELLPSLVELRDARKIFGQAGQVTLRLIPRINNPPRRLSAAGSMARSVRASSRRWRSCAKRTAEIPPRVRTWRASSRHGTSSRRWNVPVRCT